MSERPALLRRIRLLLALFITGLVLSGLTALPLSFELGVLNRLLAPPHSELGLHVPELQAWVQRVHLGLDDTYARYPWIAYGTDWLAFAHIAIAVAFLGVWRDPVRNVWVVEFGLIACALIVPTALVFGGLRGIPLYWRVIDMSFGALGALPLLVCHRLIRRVEALGALGALESDKTTKVAA